MTKKYLGNTNTKQVHNLDKVTVSCQVNEIKEEHKKQFSTLSGAEKEGFDRCAYCIGD